MKNYQFKRNNWNTWHRMVHSHIHALTWRSHSHILPHSIVFLVNSLFVFRYFLHLFSYSSTNFSILIIHTCMNTFRRITPSKLFRFIYIRWWIWLVCQPWTPPTSEAVKRKDDSVTQGEEVALHNTAEMRNSKKRPKEHNIRSNI